MVRIFLNLIKGRLKPCLTFRQPFLHLKQDIEN
uniref:Uncharacterized protein n=1 Tax=Neisseria meningitidis alpha153 TaxID=663926 RepID=C6SAB5_NEIME|nr:hypothetical protein predicted by Glimmer/Critica [Neisseria meningitidis alpha153]